MSRDEKNAGRDVLRVLIVDDEALARERLHALLHNEPGIEIAGECASGPEAITAIRGTPPDLVFLDMQMPGCDGLQVLAAIPEANRPAIVFVTAHVRFALDAFDAQAIDYLLKPFNRERLRTAIHRARERIQTRRAGDLGRRIENLLGSAAGAEKNNERLAVKTDGRLVFLKPDEICWVEAADNHVMLHLATTTLTVRETLSALEARLGPANFARVNRSALVHLDQIKELQPTFQGDYTVVLREGTRLPLSRSLRGQLGKFGSGGA